MTSKFGKGFIVPLMLIGKHFALPPEQAWYGAGDHLDDLVVPDQFRGTEVEELTDRLRKHVIWHTPGNMDKEDALEVTRIMNKLVVAIDRALGIKDADIGEFH